MMSYWIFQAVFNKGETMDKEFNGHETDKPALESVEIQTSGDMALSLLKNIIAELGPNKGVEFLLDMATTLISNIQSNIATNGFTKISDTEAIKDMTLFCAKDIDFKINDILENATYTFVKESDKKIWEGIQEKKKKQQEELEEQRKINALLNSPVVPMKDGFVAPDAQYGEDGMEKVDPQVLSILNRRKK